MYVKKHLGQHALLEGLSQQVERHPDHRNTQRISHSLHDTVMSAMACMFIQSPSLLHFERIMEKKHRRNNLQTQFLVKTTPSDTQMREILDGFDGATVLPPVFKDYLSRLQRGKWLSRYEFNGLGYLLPLDGTQFHSSKTTHCEHCLTTTLRNGKTHYSHKVVQAAIVHPNLKEVLPLMPEQISNTDGKTKQDCEIAGAKRLMDSLKQQHPRLPFIRLGDALYATTPFIKSTLASGDHYIYSVLPGSHDTLFQQFASMDMWERVEVVNNKGVKYIYQWCTDLNLTEGEESVQVNVMRLRICKPKQDGTYDISWVGTWITDLSINANNVVQLVEAGRCRWRIENECFNSLKNQGYEVEHNYGHGDEYLCFNFYLFTLLAFYLHQILSLSCTLFQQARKVYGPLRELWEAVRFAFKFILFESWEQLLQHLVKLSRDGPQPL